MTTTTPPADRTLLPTTPERAEGAGIPGPAAADLVPGRVASSDQEPSARVGAGSVPSRGSAESAGARLPSAAPAEAARPPITRRPRPAADAVPPRPAASVRAPAPTSAPASPPARAAAGPGPRTEGDWASDRASGRVAPSDQEPNARVGAGSVPSAAQAEAARPPITRRPRPAAGAVPPRPAASVRGPAPTPAPAPALTSAPPAARAAVGPRPRTEGDWFLLPAPQPANPVRLFCFPHAGGDATAFTPLARAIVPAAEVWALRPPARGGRSREPMPADFDALVEAVVGALAPHLGAGRRAAFYGQSFGALLAYEVAQALPADRRPELVVVAGAPGPDEWTERGTKDLDAAELLRLTGLEELVLADPELAELALGGIRTDLAVSATYRYRPRAPIGSALYALAGADDPMLATTDLTGWAAHTRGAFGHRVLPGGHLLATVDRPGPVDLLTSLLTPLPAGRRPADPAATEEQPSW
ncbi:thioesterase domain-containing protein [Kitasatospora sp. NPDC057692]|uniref:thioesterase domain-containing protein n=1 Tax=Kitasatospora sp. NPDC057692 TaxID=3346215 RepID=UPI0036A906E6